MQRFPATVIATAQGKVAYRHAGRAERDAGVILLHGIGSGSATWVAQLDAASRVGAEVGVLAWDAPGYGETDPVEERVPNADAYAYRLWAWLDALGNHQQLRLVGHSLGALIVARAALLRPKRVVSVLLLSPAQGHLRADELERKRKLTERLAVLGELGPVGMAEKRGAAMLSRSATDEQRAFVKAVMAQVSPPGYAQAARLLSGGDLLGDVAKLQCPVVVASGRADQITPVDACKGVAKVANVEWIDLGEIGHACAVEGATSVNTLLGFHS